MLTSKRNCHTASRRFSPRLEVLEDRALPSTFTVLNLADSGPDSLRAAVLAAEADPGPNVINFAPTVHGMISLTKELSITRDVTIDGPGADKITVSGGGLTRVFSISGATTHVAIDDLTIANGRVQDDFSFGAGLLNNGANVSVTRIAFTNNQVVGSFASGGGAIASLFGGNLTVDHTTFRGNVAVGPASLFLGSGAGGAVLNDAGSNAVIEYSTFIDNKVTAGGSFGGAIGQYDGSRMTVSHCTFHNNLAQGGPGLVGFGGAIETDPFGFFSFSPTTLTVTDSSFTGNQAIGGNFGGEFGFASQGGGGAIAISSGPFSSIRVVCTVSHSTFQGNVARGKRGAGGSDGHGVGGGVFNDGTFTFDTSTVIKKNRASTSNDDIFP
jgi:Right handed beta helix region